MRWEIIYDEYLSMCWCALYNIDVYFNIDIEWSWCEKGYDDVNQSNLCNNYYCRMFCRLWVLSLILDMSNDLRCNVWYHIIAFIIIIHKRCWIIVYYTMICIMLFYFTFIFHRIKCSIIDRSLDSYFMTLLRNNNAITLRSTIRSSTIRIITFFIIIINI